MGDCVDREAVLDLAKDIIVSTNDGEYRHRCIDPQAVRELPSVDRKKGKWRGWAWEKCIDFETEEYKSVRGYTCSECHRGTAVAFKFCPNCGADMRGET